MQRGRATGKSRDAYGRSRRTNAMSSIGRERWQAVGPYLDQALEILEASEAKILDLIESAWARNPVVAADLETLLEERAVLRREQRFSGTTRRRPTSVPEAEAIRHATKADEIVRTRFTGSVHALEPVPGKRQ